MSYQKHNFEAGAVLFASQLNDMDNQIEFLSNQGSSFSDDFKTALLNCFENVAWINENGQTYYDALYDSLYPDNMWSITNILTGCITSNNATSIFKNNSYVATITANQGYTLNGATVNISMGGNDVTSLYYSSGSINIPSVTGDLVITVLASSAVTSISAVFTQGQNIIYDTDSLDTLKQYLVVTATYADSTTATVTDYTLSGTLTAGTSTITASYGGKTDTFNVTVTGVVYLFKDGNECSAVTGGWDTKGFNTSGGSHIARNDGEALVIQLAGGGNHARSLSTINSINLGNYSRICIDAEVYNGAGSGTFWAYFPTTIANSTTQSGAYGSDYSSNRRALQTMTNPYPNPAKRSVLDSTISNYTSHTNAYISLNLNLYSGYTAGAYAKVYAIYLKP